MHTAPLAVPCHGVAEPAPGGRAGPPANGRAGQGHAPPAFASGPRLAWFAPMVAKVSHASDNKTMFEIYRESDYNRAFHFVFFTDLDEHNRGKEIARAAAGETVFHGFVGDDRKEAARAEVAAIVDELNAMD